MNRVLDPFLDEGLLAWLLAGHPNDEVSEWFWPENNPSIAELVAAWDAGQVTVGPVDGGAW